MTIFGARRAGQRLAAVDAYQFPSSVRQRFALQHSELTADSIGLVETGARQWFRLAVRHPKAGLAMPSVAVDELWHEFVLHTREYAEFCETTLGRFLHHVPESAMSAEGAADNRAGKLRETFRMAQRDEGGDPGRLPVLFRVDQELGIAGGRHYLADCGGRGVCYELKGTVCVEHLGGPGKRPGGSWNATRISTGGTSGTMGSPGGDGCGGGCGGGGD